MRTRTQTVNLPAGGEMNGPEQIDHLRKLWLLDILVQEGAFAPAAMHAKVTRSAISQTISQLEKAHRKILLVRERGSVKPTSYCLEVLEKARPLLKQLGSLEIKQGQTIPQMSWLDIGAYESLAITLMPPLIDVLKRKCPGIKLSVKVARSGKLSSMVRNGELCMAIVIENEIMAGLSVIAVGEERLGFYVSSALPKKLQNWKASLAELPVGDLLAGPEGQPRYHSKFIAAAGLASSAGFTSDSLEAILAATAHGSIVGLLPQRVAARATVRLHEVTPPSLVQTGLGVHKICLVSRQNCDAKENEFLASELKLMLKP